VFTAAPILSENQSFSCPAGIALNYELVAVNSPVSYAHVSGTLPPGITFNTFTGRLSGIPTTQGTYIPSFTATNPMGTSPAVSVTLTITAPPPPVITANQSASGSFDSAFSYQIAATSNPVGGNPSSYALASGSLPAGISLNTTTGVLSGMPTAAGTFTPAFTATSLAGTSDPVVVTLTIHTGRGLIIYEPFDYVIGASDPDADGGLNGGNGLPATNTSGNPAGTGTGLRGSWGATTNVVAGLSYLQGTKALVTSGNAARANNAASPANLSIYSGMTTDPFLSKRVSNGGNLGPDGTSIYVSFIGSTSSAAADAFRFNLRSSVRDNFYVSNTTTGWSLNGTAATGAPLALNTPTLFVVRFDFAAGSTDTVSLWINPILGQTLGAANVVVSGINFPGLGNFQSNPAVANAMTFDELRVGTSLADVTPHVSAPATPSALSATAVSTSQINLTWSDNSSDEAFFKLERSADGSSDWTQIATPSANATSISDTGRAAGTTYYYRLRANNAAGDSGFSNVANATTLNGLQGFRAANGLAANGSQDLLTPAGDGIANLLKYAFNMLGSDIGQANSLSTANTFVVTQAGSAGMPLVSVGSGIDAGKLRITYIRRKPASSPGITYAVEFSDALTGWAVNASAVEVPESIDATFERVTVTDSTVTTSKRFARVRVTSN
ncbi:MAG TPA: putative Ig domain-containing protein, partial [Chthoniobacterales bacterium]